MKNKLTIGVGVFSVALLGVTAACVDRGRGNVGAVQVGAPAIEAQATHTGSLPKLPPKLQSFSRYDETGSLRVDMTSSNFDPVALDNFMVKNPGVSLNVVESAPENENLDDTDANKVRRAEERVKTDRVCDGLPRVQRANRAVANSVCDSRTGRARYGSQYFDSPQVALQKALSETIVMVGGETPSLTAEVQVNGTHARVNFKGDLRSFIDASRTDASKVSSAFIETVYSDARVESFQFLLNDSCIDYALSLGGDTCVNITSESLPTG